MKTKPFLPILVVPVLLPILLLGGCDQQAPEHRNPDAAENQHGEHNGRLLKDENLSVELAIYEATEDPEFRAWIKENNRPVAPDAVELSVILTRLGAPRETVRFQPEGDFLRGDLLIREPHSFGVEVELSHRGRSHRWAYDSFEGRTRISAEMARTFGLETELAGPAMIEETVHVFGRVVPDPTSTHHVHARFPGIVRSVEVEIGSTVERGDVLARIESDDSLTSYPVTAPAGGIVKTRSVNVGEHTSKEALFTIVDLSTVWGELALFPKHRASVRIGQPVEVSSASGDALQTGSVQWIGLETHPDQSVRVRVVLPNPDGRLIPGMHLTADMAVASHPVALAVRRDALQSFRDFTVVYAQVGEEYEVRMLELGRRDGNWVEVLGGLEPTERYVSRNSYLIKADIEKAGAAHFH